MTGTLVNTATIIAGSLLGIILRSRLSRRAVDIVFQGIGLFTLALGVSMSLSSDRFLLIILSIVGGSLLGQWMRIDKRLDRFSGYLHAIAKRDRVPVAAVETPPLPGAVPAVSGSSVFTEGFITATMLYCVGSMSILGAIEDGMGLTPNLLYTKSIMDGVTSIILASSFGIAIMLSAIPVLVYQGLLTLLAYYVSTLMSQAMIDDLTAVGGIMLIGLSVNILKVKEVNVVNMLPALVVILILSYYWG
ncbi:MAG: DUF554 domain-containing protein [Rikenellaceae bacterium]|nr:DUF554 domain-containing protein [Rikenellaceae bacterium]